MRFLTIIIFAGVIFSLHSCSKTGNESGSDEYISFREGFINPPVHAQPKVYWWWLNGNVDTVRVKEELRSIRNAGMGGVDIFEIGVPAYANPEGMIPAGPAFMGAESQRTIQYAIREASKLGLEIGFNLASSWNAGGTWTKPEHAAKSLYFSGIRIKGPGLQNISLPFPEIPGTDSRKQPLLIEFRTDGKPAYYEEVVVLAVPAGGSAQVHDTTQIINVSEFFDAEREIISWEPPAGEWNIFRYVCANSGEALKLPSPNSMAPIIDHYDSAATHAHFMFFVKEFKRLFGDLNNTGLKNFYLASYEATGSPWTSTLPAAYKKVNGYDIFKLLPALFARDFFAPELNRKFEEDFTRTLSHLIINNHYRKAREISNKYGVKITSEAGGPGKPLHNVPVEALSALGSLDVPRGEFWNDHHRYDEDSIDIMWLVKEISAASNIYQRNIVEEEAFTSFKHWQEGPFDLKPLADRAFCEGMNRVVVHGFTHNPSGIGFPGIVYHAGTHYNDKRVWWSKIKPFNDYLARISFILQEADFSADVLHYYGDKIPNFVKPKNTRYKVGDGYDYEVINTEILLKDLVVKDGKLLLPGGQFSVLSLEEEPLVNPGVLMKLRDLAKEGAVIVGEKPVSVRANPQNPASKEIVQLIDDLWIASDHTVKGKIVSGVTPLQMLENLEVGPDFRYADNASAALDYVHYKKEDLDFYLICNRTDVWTSRRLEFRQQGKRPEIWNPVTGKMITAPIFRREGNYTTLPLTLPPYGSLFVVFRRGSDAGRFEAVSATGQHPPLMEYSSDGIYFLEPGTFELVGTKSQKIQNNFHVREITGEWNVSFPPGWGAPGSETFDKLISWPESEDTGIKYFSGTATYMKSFDFVGVDGGNKRIFLDLGEVEKVAEAWLNDQRLDISWAKPHQYDITGLIREGKNNLKIEISNTWSNRLTGDAITGQKFTQTNITNQEGVRWKDMPLLRSGLLGPVTIQIRTLVE